MEIVRADTAVAIPCDNYIVVKIGDTKGAFITAATECILQRYSHMPIVRLTDYPADTPCLWSGIIWYNTHGPTTSGNCITESTVGQVLSFITSKSWIRHGLLTQDIPGLDRPDWEVMYYAYGKVTDVSVGPILRLCSRWLSYYTNIQGHA